MSGLDVDAEIGEMFGDMYTRIDDWWWQFFTLRVHAPALNNEIKEKFISFAIEEFKDSDANHFGDNDLSILFVQFIEEHIQL
tara:strand:+ start:336 stop:581 length:246 start_codon:yes stop_codon:yes gene_type:complete